MKEKNRACSARQGKVGGQAVMEGIMMRGPKRYCTAVRTQNRAIVRDIHPNTSIKERIKPLGWPIVRGVVNFAESMILSFSTLNFAADAIGYEDETAFDRWLTKHFGKALTTVCSLIGTVLGLGLAIVLFFWLPALISNAISPILPVPYLCQVLEGLIKIALFLCYVCLISLIPDIKRVFMYHGAEHKTIFCYEAQLELTVENAKKQSRLHPRCGTSFMILMMFVGVAISLFLPRGNTGIYVLLKLLTLPAVVGLGYEIIRYAGRHNNPVIRFLTAPGKWMQRITTKEPTDDMLEVAIVALKTALDEEFSEDQVFENIPQPEAEPAKAPAETAEEV